jgi:hypothetical protein
VYNYHDSCAYGYKWSVILSRLVGNDMVWVSLCSNFVLLHDNFVEFTLVGNLQLNWVVQPSTSKYVIIINESSIDTFSAYNLITPLFLLL